MAASQKGTRPESADVVTGESTTPSHTPENEAGRSHHRSRLDLLRPAYNTAF